MDASIPWQRNKFKCILYMIFQSNKGLLSMKNTWVYLSLLASLLILGSCGNNDPKKIKLETEEDKTFYAMGYMLGGNLQRLTLSDKELAALYKGVAMAAKNEKSEVEMATYQNKIQEVFKARMDKVAEKEKEAGKAFLEKFVTSEGATKTASGLAYKVIKEGTGATPAADDIVEVHYHGTLTDGTVFDSSVERGKTISFPLNRVIKGWTEGLQTMKEGGKTKFVIPSDLAYGEAGAPPKIPGGATLVFEVELFKVTKAADANKPAKKK
jgi:FKBP-type peptidyl-prolyl cis-trans isomerase FkpA